MTTITPTTRSLTAKGATEVTDSWIPGVASTEDDVDVSHLAAPTYLGARTPPRSFGILLRALVPVLAFVLWWQATSQGWVSRTTIASPGQVWDAFREIQTNGQLRDFVGASAGRAGWGIVIGVTVGLVLGLTAGLTALAEGVVDPAMQMLRTIPFLALSPLFILWFGIDEQYKIILIAYATSLPMYAYAYLGVRNVDRKVVEAARGFGLKGWRLSLRVILPSALPNVLMALRICLAISMTALIVAEGIGTDKGIGYLVLLGKQYFRTDYMMLSIVLYALLGLGFDALIRVVERLAMPWRRHTTIRG
jgi:sulfonate transport system permease protein